LAHREITPLRLGRTLSIDPRSRRLAWAYFKDGDLDDCGIKTCRDGAPAVRVTRLAIPYLIDLFDHFSPHALLVPKISGDRNRPRSPQVARVIRSVVREAVKRGIAVHVVSGDTVKESFSQPNGEPARNKEDIHSAILDRFPELTVMVPRARAKIWESEQYFTPLFNAVAMYLAWSYQLSNVDEN
jgi:hypothetical protein